MQYTPVTVKQMRNNLSDVLEKVAGGGEAFVVTKFGKQKAFIIPVDKKTIDEKRKMKILNETFGMWKDREDMKDPAKWLRDIRKRNSSRYGKIFK
jgi:prevent-host-death family protein